MRLALGIEYDGRAYSGWQFQPHARNVQEVLEGVLGSVAAHPVRVRCAGRTDAGVHASGQVIHFDSGANRDPRAWVLGANSRLPADVSVAWARAVPPGFDARFSATGRVYRYAILNRSARSALLDGRVTWDHRPLEVERMCEAAAPLLGRHDFSSFRAGGCQAKSPVRTLRRFDIWRSGDLVLLEVEADAFLQHMVRNLAGVLAAIGAGQQPTDWAAEVLARRDRTAGGVTAPPDGLYLIRVLYPAQYDLPVPVAGNLIGGLPPGAA